MNPLLKQTIQEQRRNVFGRKRYWFHIAIWFLTLLFLSFVLAEVFTGFKSGLKVSINNFDEKKVGRLISDRRLIASFLATTVGLAALLVYTLLLYIIPYARYRKRKRFLWLGLLTGAVVWIIGMLLMSLWLAKFYPAAGKDDYPIVALIIFGMGTSFSGTIASYFCAFYYFVDLYDQQKNLNEYQQVFTLRLQAETNFLQTQINPHFLFNTLNNIYSLTLKESDDAPVITRRLKELIAYMLDDFSKETVSLEEEVSFLKNYMELEQLRNKEGQADIRFVVNGDVSGKQIAPLLLVNFIENAFKHGVKSGIDRSFVYISLDVTGDKLLMEINNSRQSPTDRDTGIVHKGGIGIRNVRRRLQLLYPGSHSLRIRKTAAEFRVRLQLKLQS